MTSIETYIDQEEWGKARRLIYEELEVNPDSHWLWATLSLTFHEQYDYEKALDCVQKAQSLAPRCPYVLWRYAGALYQLGLAKEALAVWKKLLRRGVSAIAYGKCGEGLVQARSLLNDCTYRIATCYAWIGQKALAARYYREHLENRKRGVRSVYALRKIVKEFAAVEAGLKARGK